MLPVHLFTSLSPSNHTSASCTDVFLEGPHRCTPIPVVNACRILFILLYESFISFYCQILFCCITTACLYTPLSKDITNNSSYEWSCWHTGSLRTHIFHNFQLLSLIKILKNVCFCFSFHISLFKWLTGSNGIVIRLIWKETWPPKGNPSAVLVEN